MRKRHGFAEAIYHHNLEKLSSQILLDMECYGCGEEDDGSDKWCIKKYEGRYYCMNCIEDLKGSKFHEEQRKE